MAEITAKLVNELRGKTGLAMMECKKMLTETGGDIEKAVAILRQQGLSKADKKSGRDARQGIVETYVHTGGRIAAMVELNCETDFVAKTDEFQALVKDIAMHVAASSPEFVSVDEIPADVRDAKKAEFADKAKSEGKLSDAAESLVVFREQQSDGTFKHDYLLSNVIPSNPLEEFARVFKAEHRVEE